METTTADQDPSHLLSTVIIMSREKDDFPQPATYRNLFFLVAPSDTVRPAESLNVGDS